MGASRIILSSLACLCLIGTATGARAESEDMEMSVRTTGPTTTYIQRSRVDVIELRGNKKDPDFVERTWASQQAKQEIANQPAVNQPAVTKQESRTATVVKSKQKAKGQSATKSSKVAKKENRKPVKSSRKSANTKRSPSTISAGDGSPIQVSDAGTDIQQ